MSTLLLAAAVRRDDLFADVLGRGVRRLRQGGDGGGFGGPCRRGAGFGGINHYRDTNRSDNKIRAYGPYSPLGAYYRLKALQEFGPFEPPIK